MQNTFSRLIQIFIFVLLVPLAAISDNGNITVIFKGNHLHFTINIPQNHRIYIDEVDNINIDLDKSQNLESFKLLLPSPVTKESFEKKVSFYENKLEFDVYLEPKDSSAPLDIIGDINYKVCDDNECKYIYEKYTLNNLLLSENYIYSILLMAILGGFILNFMPCVLPILSLKVYSIMNSKKKHKNELLFTILGIFTVFWVLAIISIWMRSIGQLAGIGMHFGDPLFITFLVTLMTIFVARIWGRETGSLFDSLGNHSSANIYLSSYVSGVLAAIFATPCTAPFLGGAIAFAAASEVSTIIFIFTMIGLGFAMPYIALLMYPRLLLALPKPGKWMENFKLILALFMVGTIFWLLSILQSQLGFRATLGMVMLLMLLKFVSEQSFATIWKVISYILLIIAIFNLPKFASKEDYQKKHEIKKLWQNFDNKVLQNAMKDGKIVVIDITADWCGTCKYNKFMLWDREKTIKLLSNPKIVALRKDITSRSLETQRFMQSIGVYGIPFNVVFGPNEERGILLTTIPSYDDLEKALKKAGL